MNAAFPAAMGNRWSHRHAYLRLCYRRSCLNQALGEGIVACGAGTSWHSSPSPAATRATASGGSVWSTRSVAASGGRRNGDGVDAVDGPQGYLQNTPVEVIEAETPLRVRRYELVPDSYAARQMARRRGADLNRAGKHRTAGDHDSARHEPLSLPPWGTRGGAAGSLGKVLLNPDTENERSIGRITVLELNKGDVVRMISPSGGGFGDPLKRPIALIEADVRSGLLSRREGGQRITAVVFRGSRIDAEQTRLQRRTRATRGRAPAFTLGLEREAYEKSWPRVLRAALASASFEYQAEFRTLLIKAMTSQGGNCAASRRRPRSRQCGLRLQVEADAMIG